MRVFHAITFRKFGIKVTKNRPIDIIADNKLKCNTIFKHFRKNLEDFLILHLNTKEEIDHLQMQMLVLPC